VRPPLDARYLVVWIQEPLPCTVETGHSYRAIGLRLVELSAGDARPSVLAHGRGVGPRLGQPGDHDRSRAHRGGGERAVDPWTDADLFSAGECSAGTIPPLPGDGPDTDTGTDSSGTTSSDATTSSESATPPTSTSSATTPGSSGTTDGVDDGDGSSTSPEPTDGPPEPGGRPCGRLGACRGERCLWPPS
jgi:hypothetical protein